jgi:hypothetical protein
VQPHSASLRRPLRESLGDFALYSVPCMIEKKCRRVFRIGVPKLVDPSTTFCGAIE